jgi:hypothetical protein
MVGEFIALAAPAAGAVGRLREAEVQHLHRAVRAHLDVGRLEIAMDDALIVRGFERIGDLSRDRADVGERHRPRAMIAERSSPSTSSMTRALSSIAVDGRDVRMIQRGEHLRLAREARDAIGVGGGRAEEEP